MQYIHSAGLYVQYWYMQACAIQEDTVHPLTPRKYLVLNGDFLLDFLTTAHILNVTALIR
jgi:hypothetical protein